MLSPCPLKGGKGRQLSNELSPSSNHWIAAGSLSSSVPPYIRTSPRDRSCKIPKPEVPSPREHHKQAVTLRD